MHCTPLPTHALPPPESHKIPIPNFANTTTQQRIIIPILQRAKGSEPRGADEDVDDGGYNQGGGGRGGYDPEKREHRGYGREGHGVGELREGADGVSDVLVQEVGCKAEDDCRAEELGEAEEGGGCKGERHGG